jgi:hypothetical protein
MTSGSRFSARQWEIERASGWRSWVAGPTSSRLADFRRMAVAVKALTRHWVADAESGAHVVRSLPSTMGQCNELDFATEAETLAYTIWHLVDRYGRVLQVLDGLFAAGYLPLRKKRMSVLEVGSGPSPASYAVTDFYLDLRTWSASQGEPQVDICPVTNLMLLDRGPAWAHLVHNLSEELLVLGESRRPRPFDITYDEFESFSVRSEHLAGIEQETRRLIAEADYWDERLGRQEARAEAIRGRAYPPGAVDLIVICNFLTFSAMTEYFAREIELLADSLTPGGVLVAVGSSRSGYNSIFEELTQLVTRSGRVTPLSVSNGPFRAHADAQAHEVVEDAIVACLRHCEGVAPDVFDDIRSLLHPEVRNPGSRRLTFPSFRVAAFRSQGVRQQKH